MDIVNFIKQNKALATFVVFFLAAIKGFVANSSNISPKISYIIYVAISLILLYLYKFLKN